MEIFKSKFVNRKRVVVTGIGVVAPGAKNKIEFLDMLSRGQSGIEFLSELKENNLHCQVGGKARMSQDKYKEVFDYFDIYDAGEFVELGCYAGLDAWLDAGLELPDYDSPDVDWKTGMSLGSGFAGVDFSIRKIGSALRNKKLKSLRSNTVPCAMGSSASAYLSNILAVGNQIASYSSACCSGLEAIIDSYNKIKFGLAERMVAGGIEAFSVALCGMFDAARVTNRKFNDRPQLASRPMSESARGFVVSSGAGIIILESLESAQNRNAKIYAEIVSGAINSGGQRNDGSMSIPNSDGVLRCINSTIKNAGVELSNIDLVSGNLSGTKGDVVEMINWSKIFEGEKMPHVNSPKSMIGHLLGASSSVETIACILQLHHSFIHPSINCEDLNFEISKLIDVNRIPQEKIDKIDLDLILKASFGFGDVNTSLLLKNWEQL